MHWKVGHFAAIVKEEAAAFTRSRIRPSARISWSAGPRWTRREAAISSCRPARFPTDGEPSPQHEGERIWGRGNAAILPEATGRTEWPLADARWEVLVMQSAASKWGCGSVVRRPGVAMRALPLRSRSPRSPTRFKFAMLRTSIRGHSGHLVGLTSARDDHGKRAGGNGQSYTARPGRSPTERPKVPPVSFELYYSHRDRSNPPSSPIPISVPNGPRTGSATSPTTPASTNTADLYAPGGGVEVLRCSTTERIIWSRPQRPGAGNQASSPAARPWASRASCPTARSRPSPSGSGPISSFSARSADPQGNKVTPHLRRLRSDHHDHRCRRRKDHPHLWSGQ